MFTNLTRHVKEKLESVNLKKVVSVYCFKRVNTRIIKSNFGVCHQLRKHTSCNGNSGIHRDDDKFGKSKKDSWTDSIHLEHSPIGLLGWSTALAIGWCMTQPFYRKSILPPEKSNWDRPQSLTRTVFAQPGGLNELGRYLKNNITNTVCTQTVIKESDKQNAVSNSVDSGLTKFGRYLKDNNTNTVFTQTEIEPTKKGKLSIQPEDSSLCHSPSKKIGGYLKYDFSEGVFREIELKDNCKNKSVSQPEGNSLHNSGLNKLGKNLEHNSIEVSNEDIPVRQSEKSSPEKTENTCLHKKDSSLRQTEHISRRKSEYSSRSQTEYNSGSLSEYIFESLAKSRPGPEVVASGHQEKCGSGQKQEGSTGVQVKDRPECQKKLHSNGCSTEPINPKLLEAAENLARIQNSLFAYFDNHLGVKDIKSGKSKTAVDHFARAIEMGNRKAMFNMGLCYELGCGVEKNLTRAAAYYRLAAQRGHLTAMYNLGVFHMYGLGDVTKDLQQALKLFMYAGSHGQTDAATAYKTLTLHLQKNKEVNGAAGSESNNVPESSTLDLEAVQLEDHNNSQI